MVGVVEMTRGVVVIFIPHLLPAAWKVPHHRGNNRLRAGRTPLYMSEVTARAGGHVRHDDAALLKALSHPLRHRIMVVLSEREASPTELSELLGAKFDNVAYHVRYLAGKLKSNPSPLIELVGTDRRHGGIQHFWKAVVRPILDTADSEKLPQILREDTSSSITRLVVDDVVKSQRARAFDSHPARSLLRMWITVDDEGMRRTGELALQFLDALTQVEAESVERLVQRGEQGMTAATATMVFPMPTRSAGS